MTVPVCLVLRNEAQELPHQGAAVSFDLPVGLRVVGRGISGDRAQKLEDALVVYRGKLTPVVRNDRGGNAKCCQAGVKEF